jgi:hypothetical protein
MTPDLTQFVECDACRAKPGTPALCAGCLHNRTAIAHLRAAMSGWTSYAWKDRAYVDDVQEYFDAVMGGTPPGDALTAISSGRDG